MTNVNILDAARTAPQFVALTDHNQSDVTLESWSGNVFLNVSEVDVDRFEQDVFVTSVHDLSQFVSLTESEADTTRELDQNHLSALIESSEYGEDDEIEASPTPAEKEVDAQDEDATSESNKRVRRRFVARPALVREEVKRPESHQDFSRPAHCTEPEETETDGGVWWSVGMDANAMIRLG
jgi:hypothetical protein